MDKDQNDQMKFLEQQLQWSEQQILILDEIHGKLHKMKQIAEYALNYELTSSETKKLNEQLNVLTDEVRSLEIQLKPVLH